MNAEVLVVVAVSILVMGPIAFCFNICRVRTFVYYLVFPPMLLVAGYAYAWALGATGNMALVITVIGGLLGVQVAWVLTTRIPRP
jgi:hypothetical protein